MDKFERFHEAESKNRTCSGFAEASKRWDEIQLQKLRDLPIEGVAERLGMRVERHKCLCPFHDDQHPSLTFSVSRNTFRCWACGAHGGTIDLAMQYLGKDFKEACEWLSNGELDSSFKFQGSSCLNQRSTAEGKVKPETLNLKPFNASRYSRYFEHPWLLPEARHFLFEERRLDERVVRWCRLTSWRDKKGVPWLQIPYYNRQGELVGVQNRNLVKGALPRFRFPHGAECSIYNLPVLNLLEPGEPLYITEGSSDCWAMLSAGHKAIAIPSATLLTREVVDQLSTLNSELSTSLHMYPDRDTPGERLFLQLQQILPNLEHHQLPPDCKDFSEMYLKMKREKTC